MIVSREELERSIARLRDEIADPAAGIYGPDSVSWRVDREIIVFLAGGRAALLQLAHPFVAHAVDRHSQTRGDPLGRFQRTFKHVFAMAFGDLDHAIASARRVHAIHQRIYGEASDGTRYEANDEDALLWVHATLVDSAVLAFERVVRPLTGHERDRYLREGHRFARLFGIPDRLLPSRWADHEAYMSRMYRELRVTAPAREMAGFLLEPPLPLLQPAARWYRLVTTGLLPPPIRDGFGFSFRRRDELAFRASLASVRAAYRALPQRLRYVPAYTRAVRRLAGLPGEDRIASWMERVLLEPGALRFGNKPAPR